MNEVANGIAGRTDVEVAIIPRGTGWDFVRTYGIPHKLEGAIDVALTGRSRTIDLGRVQYRAWDGSDAEAWFANVASAGMSGAIAQRANETTKALGGKISYLWATFAVFARWQSSDLRVSVDDQIRGGRMHDVVVANGRTFGGGMIICPEAEPDDGLFDVLTIGDLTKRDLMVTLPKTYRGSHLPHPKAELLRGAIVSVDADSATPDRARRRAARHDSGALRGRAGRPARARPRRQVTGYLARPRLLRRRRLARRRRLLAGRCGLRAGGFFAASCFSSFATRFSSSSRPRSFFCMSSSRVRVSFAMSTSFDPPGTSWSLLSASAPRSCTRERMSFCCVFAMRAIVPGQA